MAVNESRSLTKSLADGATDGKYRKVRPNTEVARGMGDELVSANRRGLHPYWNYDYIEQEASVKVAPGSMDKASAGRAAGADRMYDNEMGANY